MAVLASETASATAGREGKATSPDGKINLNLSPAGSHGPGTNPEQLFGAGYSACFGSAIALAASLAKISLKANEIKVTATVNLNKDESGYFLDVTLNAELKGVDQAQAEALVGKAHTLCPYSKATRGNIEVKLQANGKALQQTAQTPNIAHMQRSNGGEVEAAASVVPHIRGRPWSGGPAPNQALQQTRAACSLSVGHGRSSGPGC